MLTIDRDYWGGYRIRSKPRNVNVKVKDATEVAQVVRHYFGRGRPCGSRCPLCAQIAAEIKKLLAKEKRVQDRLMDLPDAENVARAAHAVAKRAAELLDLDAARCRAGGFNSPWSAAPRNWRAETKRGWQ
jgi:hypothetical protein